jgi:hypothetical protein
MRQPKIPVPAPVVGSTKINVRVPEDIFVNFPTDESLTDYVLRGLREEQMRRLKGKGLAPYRSKADIKAEQDLRKGYEASIRDLTREVSASKREAASLARSLTKAMDKIEKLTLKMQAPAKAKPAAPVVAAAPAKRGPGRPAKAKVTKAPEPQPTAPVKAKAKQVRKAPVKAEKAPAVPPTAPKTVRRRGQSAEQAQVAA